MKRSAQLVRRSPLRRVSSKRSRELRRYYVLRAAYLTRGECDVNTCCRSCHREIHANRTASRALGFLTTFTFSQAIRLEIRNQKPNTKMPSINDAFPSDFLKVDDLQGKNVTVTIASAKIDEIGQGQNRERKIIIALVGKTKKLVCNKTNAKVIAGLYGDDLDGWANQRITLCPREVEFQGSMVLAIRVSLQKPGLPAQGSTQPPPPKPQPVAATANVYEDIPF